MGYKLDPVDLKILDALSEDGRIHAAEIARRTGVGERTVRNRMERLREGGILEVQARVKPAAVGYPITADIFLHVEAGRVTEVAERVAELPEVGYVAVSTGDRDVSIQAYFASPDDLHIFVNEKLGRIPGVIRTVTAVVPRIVKDIWHWRVPRGET